MQSASSNRGAFRDAPPATRAGRYEPPPPLSTTSRDQRRSAEAKTPTNWAPNASEAPQNAAFRTRSAINKSSEQFRASRPAWQLPYENDSIRACCVRDGKVVAALGKRARLLVVDLKYSTREKLAVLDSAGSVERLFVDASGRHALVRCGLREWSYVNLRAADPLRVESLPDWANLRVECLAFPGDTREDGTGRMLLATAGGDLYEASVDSAGKQRHLKLLYSLGRDVAVTSVHVYQLGNLGAIRGAEGGVADASAPQPKLLVLVMTQSPTRLYYFCGYATLAQVFRAYREELASLAFQDLPAMQMQERQAEFSPHSDPFHQPRLVFSKSDTVDITVLSPGYLFHGTFIFQEPEVWSAAGPQMRAAHPTVLLESAIDAEAMESVRSPVLSFVCSAGHYLVLSTTGLVPVNRILSSERLAAVPVDDVVPGAVALVEDPASSNYYIVGPRHVCQLIIEDEDRFTWLMYLKKALAEDKPSLFEEALRQCRGEDQARQVHSSHADFLYAQGDLGGAARFWAAASSPFENVYTKLSDADPSGLSVLVYIREALDALDKANRVQAAMLGFLGLELHLSILAACPAAAPNAASDGDLPDRAQMVEQTRKFLSSYSHYLHKPLVFGLLESHGEMEIFEYYALLMDEYERLLPWYLSEGRYLDALQCLSASDAPNADLLYAAAPELVLHHPRETFDLVRNFPNPNPVFLIPSLSYLLNPQGKRLRRDAITRALLANKHRRVRTREIGSKQSPVGASLDALEIDSASPSAVEIGTDKDNLDMAIEFLEVLCGKDGRPSEAGKGSQVVVNPAVLSFLLYLLAKFKPDQDLIRVLLPAESESGPEMEPMPDANVDLGFALRVCSVFKRHAACVYIYGALGLYEEAVRLALQVGHLPAKSFARLPSESFRRKQLWRMIVRDFASEQDDIERALKAAEESDLLGVEDVLPLLGDTTSIATLRDHLHKALSEYGQNMNELKEQIVEAEAMTEELSRKTDQARDQRLQISQVRLLPP
eukprot:scaffold602_cov298-Pinguiococcus_pyrenoidosus.AAC.32